MVGTRDVIELLRQRNPRGIARAISLVENGDPLADAILESLDGQAVAQATVIGITGPPGAGKSTLTSELIAHHRARGHRLGIVAVDPSSPFSGGAILGDRVRMMRHATDPDVVLRSMATRGRLGGLCAAAGATVRIMASSGCSPVIIETVGVGQSEIDIVRLADVTVVVLAPGLGDEIQAMKAGLLEVADVIAVNKADLPGAQALALEMEAALRDRRAGEGRPPAPVICLVSAAEGRGIADLAGLISDRAELLAESGGKAERRAKASQGEVLDWALEGLRAKLSAAVKDEPLLPGQDPKLQAARLLQRLKM